MPDLAIEIASEHDTFVALMKKISPYRACGTAEVWLFSREARLAFVLSELRQEILDEDGNLESSLIPGFSIRLGDLFDGRVRP